MTGRPILRERLAGITMLGKGTALEPNPPPQNSDTNTMSSCGMPSMADRIGMEKLWLWTEPWRWHLPFSQYAMVVRGSML